MNEVVKLLLGGIVLVGAAGAAGFAYLGNLSKNGSAPGLVDGRLAPCPSSPNCVSSEAGTDRDKLVFSLRGDDWEKLPEVIADMGGEVTVQSDNYIASEFISETFSFVDDVEFRRAGDAVHVRSASRVGYSDRGVNAQRVEKIRAGLAE